MNINKQDQRFYQEWSRGQVGLKASNINQLWNRNKESLKGIVDFKQFVKLIAEGFTPKNIRDMHDDNILTITK